jgi:uncharacterized coiled-coil DUF342 family protein
MKNNREMKKYFYLVLTGLMMSVMVQSQTTETLTNGSVIKMTKAKLSDELIIDMIQTSPSKFDLSDEALKKLEGENVSHSVIEAMKKTGFVRNSSPENRTADTKSKEPEIVMEPEVVKNPEPEPGPDLKPELNAGNPPAKNTPSGNGREFSTEALNYIIPLIDLVKFNEEEFKSYEKVITELDVKVKDFKNEVSKSGDQLLQSEKALMQKINSDTKPFGDEIKELNEKVKESREKFRESKTNMSEGGEDIIKQLEALKNERLHSLSKSYSEASQNIGSASADPVIGRKTADAEYKPSAINIEKAKEIIYANEMLAWYQNEIEVLKEIIKTWNPRVEKVIAEDARLLKQLEPLEIKLNELKPNAKQNKTDITALKKEITRIEKERKELADQMKNDRKELASFIKQLNEKNQDSVGDRFTDIIENITYSFREKLSL